MNTALNLTTDRLSLRPHVTDDAGAIVNLLESGEVATTTALIPYPYTLGNALQWLDSLPSLREQGEVDFAIILRKTQKYIGSIGLKNVDAVSDRAELGYWLGKPYWNRGYGTEAASAVIDYGFRQMRLNRIFAIHFRHNIGSGRIMKKIGMTHEGCLRQNSKKNGRYLDCEIYSILKDEYTFKPVFVNQD